MTNKLLLLTSQLWLLTGQGSRSSASSPLANALCASRTFTTLWTGTGLKKNMFHYVYTLQSSKDGDLYVGLTADLRRRLGEHNAGKNFSTRRLRPWKLIFYEAYTDKDDALRREKYLKSSQGARLLKRMLKEFLYKQKHTV